MNPEVRAAARGFPELSKATVASHVLVTLPVHNEERMLSASVHRLIEDLNTSGLQYQLSLAEDGSEDGTVEVIEGLAVEFPDLIVRTDSRRQGRGEALRKLWREIDSDIYVFADADLAAGAEALVRVVDEIGRGADVATGSRYCPGADVCRPPLRDLVSRQYNRLVRFLFRDSIWDHQCGLKAFSRAAMTHLMSQTIESSWAWDTEVLIIASHSGMNVVEVPIEWREYRHRRTSLRRLASDFFLHGVLLLRLKGRLADQELPIAHSLGKQATRRRLEPPKVE